MAGVITRLVYQKKNRQRVNVYLDEVFVFAVPDTVAARLRVGQALSDADIAGLEQDDSAAKAYDKAIRHLGSRPRSQAEIEDHLRQAEIPDELAAKTVARLQELGYIDDAAFAAWWVENRSRFSPRSAQALRYELQQKGVDRSIIDEALSALDVHEQALAAGRMRAERWRRLPQEAFDHKMLGYLQRRGFDYATARSVTSTLWQEPANELDAPA